MTKNLSLVSELVTIRESALTTVLHAEHCLEQMGLLRKRTEGGVLHTNRILQAIQREKEMDAEEERESPAIRDECARGLEEL